MIYGYLRKSNEEGVNSSFDTQRYKIECYCNLHNLKVDNGLNSFLHLSSNLLITSSSKVNVLLTLFVLLFIGDFP